MSTDLLKEIIKGDKKVIESIENNLMGGVRGNGKGDIQIHLDYGYITKEYLSKKDEYVY